MRIARLCLASVVALRAAGQAQDAGVRIRSGPYAPPGTVISVESKLVEMTAVVHDPEGRSVGDCIAKISNCWMAANRGRLQYFPSCTPDEPSRRTQRLPA